MEKRPSLRTVPKGRVKMLINEFTEKKHSTGKSRTITERSGPDSHERGRTLPSYKVSATEVSKTNGKVTRLSTLNGHQDERARTCTNSVEKEKTTDVNSSPKFTFHEKLDKRQSQSHSVESKLTLTIPTSTDEINLPSVRFKELVYNDDERTCIQKDVEEDVENMFKIPQDETDNVLDGLDLDSDDMFGLNDFEEFEDNYIVEAFNKPGEELRIATLQITLRTISPGDMSNEQPLEVINFNGSRGETEEPFNHYKKLGVHIGNEGVFEDQTHYSSGSEIFEDANEYVNMNCVTSNAKTLEKNNNIEGQTEDNYYNLPDSSIEVANDGQSPGVKTISNGTSLGIKANNKINNPIEELITTEKRYISILRTVVESYAPYIFKHTPPHLLGKTPYLFGNISIIYREAQEFLKSLKNCNQTADEVAKVFIQSAPIFDAYPRYSKDKPTADIYLKQFDEVVKRRQKELGDKLGLASHLVTPIQRLGKYIIILENIQKDVTKQGKPSESVNEAINIIRNMMRKSDDLLAIKNCNIDLSLQGSFIMKASFNILKPRKFRSTVFLYDEVLVFTKKVANMEGFTCVDSIQMTHLGIAKYDEKPCIFSLLHYLNAKKANHDAVTYVFEAKTPEIKNDWIDVIKAKLWSQLQSAKDIQNKAAL